jgi:hypothetical protein
MKFGTDDLAIVARSCKKKGVRCKGSRRGGWVTGWGAISFIFPLLTIVIGMYYIGIIYSILYIYFRRVGIENIK